MVTPLETTDFTPKMVQELHETPYGPLSMYASLPLKRRGRRTTEDYEDQLDYSILYFPDRNKSHDGKHEEITVIKHNDEYANESKRVLEAVTSLRIGKLTLNQYQEEKDAWKIEHPAPEQKPGLLKQCQQLGLPYMAVLFSSSLDTPEISCATLYVPAYARALKIFDIFRTSIESSDVHFYEVKAAKTSRSFSNE